MLTFHNIKMYCHENVINIQCHTVISSAISVAEMGGEKGGRLGSIDSGFCWFCIAMI